MCAPLAQMRFALRVMRSLSLLMSYALAWNRRPASRELWARHQVDATEIDDRWRSCARETQASVLPNNDKTVPHAKVFP
jgi:hypothetical protein